jgi:hypothetical protein
MTAFVEGDRVAWDHAFATVHAAGSIVRADAVPPTAKVGTVTGPANDEGTWWNVQFDDGEVTLTEDELVKVEDAPAVAEEAAA